MERMLAAAYSARRAESERRTEILDTAAELFASAGYIGTSLKDVSDACGILPGSLYHHFESKEAIAIELLQGYQTDLDTVAESAVHSVGELDASTAFTRIATLAIDIAACALRHSAALQLSQYEPHSGASDELTELARRRPSGLHARMHQVLAEAADVGYLKSGTELEILTDQVVETMLHTGLSALHSESSADRVATVLCRLLFEGIAAREPIDPDLDDSSAMHAACRAVQTWAGTDRAEARDRFALIRSVAREEFARRGYEATTVRDIAAAAGIATGSVYRLVESKQTLLMSIMDTFHGKLSSAYTDVVSSESTAVEKLDALIWVNLSAVETFDREFEIQRAWFRLSPPDVGIPFVGLKKRSQQIRNVVEAGKRAGEFRVQDVALKRLAACVRDLIWAHPRLVERVGKSRAQVHARATFLRGASYRRTV